MPRAVSPWTWRRALRDHGPENPAELLTCYTIGTFMDREGFAFPSQKTIAAGIRASLRTVQRHLTSIERQGWINVKLAGRGGQGWRHSAYRASVPDHVPLEDLDEKLSDIVVAQCGDVDEPDDTAMSPRLHSGQTERGDIRSTKVATNPSERGDTGRQNVATQLWRTNSYSETPALRALAKTTEAQSGDCAASFSLREEKREEVLQGSIEAIGAASAKPLRRLTDEQLSRQLDKLATAGMTSIAEASKLLEGNYVDVGPARLWRIVEEQREARRRKVVV